MTQENQPINNRQQQPDESGENKIHGRIYNTNNPEFEQIPARNDISSIDQQEGNMAHGEEGPDQEQDSKENK
ncbi:MAG TPA: hypothetical protein VFL47_03590 [Flavisolibacter sp.]|nr:hypothetical protein [Flavisolibacter sp.]